MNKILKGGVEKLIQTILRMRINRLDSIMCPRLYIIDRTMQSRKERAIISKSDFLNVKRMEIVRAGRSKSPSKKINGFFFSRNRNKYTLQYTHYDRSHVIRPLTLTHDHSKIRRAVSRRPTGAKMSLDEVDITIVRQSDQQSDIIADFVSLTMTGIFNRDSELRESIERVYTEQRIHNRSTKRGTNYAHDNAFVLEVCETNGSDFNARYGNTINLTLTAKRIAFTG